MAPDRELDPSQEIARPTRPTEEPSPMEVLQQMRADGKDPADAARGEVTNDLLADMEEGSLDAKSAPRVDDTPEPAPSSEPAEVVEEAISEEPRQDVIEFDGEKFSPDEVKAAMAAAQNMSQFDNEIRTQLQEMRETRTQLEELEASVRAREEGLEAQARENAAYRQYLINQGVEVGDPMSRQLADVRYDDDGVTAGGAPLTADQVREIVKGTLVADREEQQKLQKEQTKAERRESMKRSFAPWVQAAIQKAGGSTDDMIGQMAYKSLCFDLAAQFEGDPEALLSMGEDTIKSWINDRAGKLLSGVNQRDSKVVSDSLSRAGASQGALPATPRVSGTPTPGPTTGPSGFLQTKEDFDKAFASVGGNLEGFFDMTERRMHARARELARNKQDVR